ncbi:MAG: hypothetical protein ACR2LI_05615 [Propionibacteriaceae bacterium]
MGQRRERGWPRPRTTRHVWVRLGGQLSPPVQGLVLEWRRHSYQWFALVMYVMETGEGGHVYLQRWYPRDQLTPVRSDPNVTGP